MTLQCRHKLNEADTVLFMFCCALQIPDAKSGEKRIDAVVVDEDAVGAVDQPGCGAKILYGDGAFERYLSQIKVRILNSTN